MIKRFTLLALVTGAAGAQTIDYAQQIKNKPGLAGYIAASTLAANCTNANNLNQQLVVPMTLTGMTTQTVGCKSISFAPGAVFRPASGQVITISGVINNPPIPIFDTSVGGAGSILLTGTQNPVIYPQWCGAKMDGTTDDLAAWNACLAAAPASGATVQITGNANSHVSGTVKLPINKPIIVNGAGRTSIISGSGFAITQLQSAGQALSNLQILDATGNSSTVGILVANGLCASIGPNQVNINNVLVTGSDIAKLGSAIKLQCSVNTHISQVTTFGWAYGLFPDTFGDNYNTALRIDGTNFVHNSIAAINCVSSGDITISHSDIESNPVGIYGNGCNTISLWGVHLETNGTNHFHMVMGELQSAHSDYAGGTAIVDASATFSSVLDKMSGFTLTNNGTGGGEGPGTLIFNSILGPTIVGTGWTQDYDRLGILQTHDPSLFSFTGATAYSFDQQLTVKGAVVDSGPAWSFQSATCGASTPTPIGTSATRGAFNAGVTGTCSVTVALPASPSGAWICMGSEQNTNAFVSGNAGLNAASCNLTVTTVNGHLITWVAFPL